MLRRNTKLIALILVFVMLMSMVALAVYEPFKVKLNLFERIVAMSLLPKEANYLTWKIIKDLQMELAPSEEEVKIAGMINSPDGTIRADNWLLVVEKEIVFGDIAQELIVSALKKLDETEKLMSDHFSLYEKFIILPEKVGD